jgi:hypothetical protein
MCGRESGRRDERYWPNSMKLLRPNQSQERSDSGPQGVSAEEDRVVGMGLQTLEDNLPEQLVESTSSPQEPFVSQALQILLRDALFICRGWGGRREVWEESWTVNRVTSEVSDDIVEIHRSSHREDEMVVSMIPNQDICCAKRIYELCLTDNIGLSDTGDEEREDVRLVDASGDELEEIDCEMAISSSGKSHASY